MSNNKISHLFFLAFVLLTQAAKGQQDPVQSQYLFSLQSLNPAYSGIHGYMDISVLGRYQWAGIEGSPRTYSIYGHTGIFSKTKKYGLGASVVQDKVGVSRTNFFHLDNAYHMKLDKHKYLSFGLRMGLVSYRQNSSLLDGDVDPFFTNNTQFSSVDIGVGSLLYSDNYFLGFSMPRVTDIKPSKERASLPAFDRSYVLTAGYIYDISPSVALRPIVLTRISEGAPLRLDMNMNVLLYHYFWLGVSYKYQSSLGVNALINVLDKYKFGYAYDYSINQGEYLKASTHEILVSVMLDVFKTPSKQLPGFSNGKLSRTGSVRDHEAKFRKGIKFRTKKKSAVRYRF